MLRAFSIAAAARAAVACVAVAGIAGCASRSLPPDAGPASPAFSPGTPCTAAALSCVILSEGALRRSRRTPIKHVVFVVQENRSFNNLFMDFPGATTARWGLAGNGKKIKIRARNLATVWDLGHASQAFFAACDGAGKPPGTDCNMDGWDNEGGGQGAPPNPAYSYVPRAQIKPYWIMAHQYVLADHTFASNLDGSFVAHQYIVAAYADRAVDFPGIAWGCEGGRTDKVDTLTQARKIGPRIRACFDIPTLATEADAAEVSWRFYADALGASGGLWSSYQADRPIYYGADWKTHVVNPPSQFLSDVAAGTLANVTWVTPTFGTSDHPGVQADDGPSWVASVVNAVGTSKFWQSSAIFVLWDDWGGMYDPVKPPYEDFDGLGFRVPLIIISPYAKQGYVTHIQYETASVLRFMEDTFGLGQLANADARANDPAGDALNYSQKPRAFRKISGGKPASYFARLERSGRGLPPSILGDD